MDALVNEQAEKALLGSILLEPQRVMPLAMTVAGLTPEAFSVLEHRLIADAMWAMYQDGRRWIDLVTLEAALRNADQLDRVGGTSRLVGLIDDTPTAAHAEYYCQIVREKWMLRRTVTIAESVQLDAMKCPENVEDFCRQVPDRFTGLNIEEASEKSNIEVMEHNIVRWEDAVAYREGDQTKAPAIGMATPFSGLTGMMAGLETGITILAGRPSAGKTTLEDMLSLHVAEMGVPVGRVTLDSTRASLLGRAQCRTAGVSMAKLKHGFAGRKQLAAIREASERIAKLKMWVRTDLSDVASIRMWALERRRLDGMGLLTIDYVQQVRASELGRSEADEVRRMTHVIGQLKKLAIDELNIPVLVLSQLSRRSDQDKEDPGLTDLRGSGALEQDADKVMILSVDRKKRKEMDEKKVGATKHKRPVLLQVAKHKDGECGPLEFWMYPPYFRFEEAMPDWEDDTLPGDQEEVDREFAVLPKLKPRDEEES